MAQNTNTLIPAIEALLNQIIESEQQKATEDSKKNKVINVNIPLRNNLFLTAVAYNGPVTIAYFSDKTCTKARSMTDNYDAAAGIAVCICKKLLGQGVFYKILKECDPTYNGRTDTTLILEKKNEANRVKKENRAEEEDTTEIDDALDFFTWLFGI